MCCYCIVDCSLKGLKANRNASGVCKVTREYFEDNSKIWPDDEIYRHRIGFEPLKIPQNPVDSKLSYDKYLRTKHGSSRGYFGNPIRVIPDDEFSIFESDIERSINKQNTMNRLQVNSENIGSGMDNNDDTKESKMSLEEAIRLIQQQLENEPQRLADEQSVITKYGSMFNPNNIRNLTSEDFISFLSYENNKHWNHIHRSGKIITKDMEKLRSVLRDFLDEAKPINERLDTIISDEKSHIDYLGRAILTPILLVVYPEKYAVYNSVTEYAIKYFGIFPDFTASETLGERYLKINNKIKEIAAKNNLSLWQMDWVWDLVSKVGEDELEDKNIETHRVESVGSSVYLTAYDDPNLKISKKSGMLGWRDRPSKLSNGDYVFVYNTETDSIETCFEIKSLSTTQNPIWQEEIDSPSSNPVYAYR